MVNKELIAALEAYKRKPEFGVLARRAWGYLWFAFVLVAFISGWELVIILAAVIISQIHFATADIIAAIKASGVE